MQAERGRLEQGAIVGLEYRHASKRMAARVLFAATGLSVHDDEVVRGTGLLERPANPSRAARSFAVVEARHRVDDTRVHI